MTDLLRWVVVIFGGWLCFLVADSGMGCGFRCCEALLACFRLVLVWVSCGIGSCCWGV